MGTRNRHKRISWDDPHNLSDPNAWVKTAMPFSLSNTTSMADVPDSKSGPRKGVWVQVPPSVLTTRVESHPPQDCRLVLAAHKPRPGSPCCRSTAPFRVPRVAAPLQGCRDRQCSATMAIPDRQTRRIWSGAPELPGSSVTGMPRPTVFCRDHGHSRQAQPGDRYGIPELPHAADAVTGTPGAACRPERPGTTGGRIRLRMRTCPARPHHRRVPASRLPGPARQALPARRLPVRIDRLA